MAVQKKEQTVAAAAKQTAAVAAEITVAVETTAEEITSPDSETTPASSFFPVCAAMAAGETTGTAAAETAEAVIPAGF